MQGTWIRQGVNGQQVRLLLCSPSGQPSLLSRDQTCPLSSSPASGVFSQHFSGKIEDQACQNQSVCPTLSCCYKNGQYHTEPKGKEDFSGKVWGEGTNPALLSTVPGGYRNPLISTLRTQPEETGVLSKGHATPGAGPGEEVSP